MGKILIVSSVEKSKDILINIIKDCGEYEVIATKSCEECRQIVRYSYFDLIIINSPLYDEVGNRLSIFLNETTNSSIIFICKESMNKSITNHMQGKGIFIVEKPLNRTILRNTINLSLIYRQKLLGILDENNKLKEKIREIKLIDRAKCTLMEYLRMSEVEAHKYIEKQAMDMRIKKVDVAKNILKIYEF